MLLKEIMQTKLSTIAPSDSVREAAKRMRDEGVGCLLVTNGVALKGFITDRDIACWLAEGHDPDTVEVSTLMKTDIVYSSPDTDIFEATRSMARNNVRRLPVIENGSLCGIVTSSDLAKVIEEEVDNFLHLEEAYIN